MINYLKCDIGAVPGIVHSLPVVVQRELFIGDMNMTVEDFLIDFFRRSHERCMINTFCFKDIKGSGGEHEVKASLIWRGQYQLFYTVLFVV